jgi:MFS superfamily sulfate permease-like transporter
VDAQAITDIDITAAEALRALNKELNGRAIALKFAHANRPLRKVLERIGFTSEIGRESIFHSVHEAADAFRAGQALGR